MDDRKILVIGLGNPLMGDDGIGISLLESLREDRELIDVDFEDGGTGGFLLLHLIRNRNLVILLDAADLGQTPGTIQCFKADQVDMYDQTVSSHHWDFRKIVEISRWLGELPGETLLFGIQPFSMEPLGRISNVLMEKRSCHLSSIKAEILRQREKNAR